MSKQIYLADVTLKKVNGGFHIFRDVVLLKEDIETHQADVHLFQRLFRGRLQSFINEFVTKKQQKEDVLPTIINIQYTKYIEGLNKSAQRGDTIKITEEPDDNTAMSDVERSDSGPDDPFAD